MTALLAWLASGKLASLAEYGGLAVLIFVSGMIVGEDRTTRTALEVSATASAKEFAAATGELAVQNRAASKLFDDTLHNIRAADDEALNGLQSDMIAASQDRDAALTALDSERGRRQKAERLTADVKAVSVMALAMPPDLRELACGGPDLRLHYDAAAGALLSPTDRTAQTGAAGRVDGAPAGAAGTAQGLSCDQLARGYIALGNHDRNTLSQLTRLQNWLARENGKTAAR